MTEKTKILIACATCLALGAALGYATPRETGRSSAVTNPLIRLNLVNADGTSEGVFHVRRVRVALNKRGTQITARAQIPR